MTYEIKWSRAHCNYFIYGSKISFLKNEEVLFENPSVPPGFTLVEWMSEVNYQEERTPVQLPLLKQDKIYALTSDIECSPKASVGIKVTFYDRSGETLGTQILPLEGGDFPYLKGSYSYSVALISLGVTSFHFRKMCLRVKGGDDLI